MLMRRRKARISSLVGNLDALAKAMRRNHRASRGLKKLSDIFAALMK